MHKRVLAKDLESLFKTLDKRLVNGFYNYSLPPGRFKLVAIGGTALGFLGLKTDSKDIDLYLELHSIDPKLHPNENVVHFAERLMRFIKEHFDGSEGIGADMRYDGVKSWSFDNFSIKTLKLKDVDFRCFELVIFDPIDICITKLARYDLADIKDISAIIAQGNHSLQELESRFQEYLPQLRKAKLIPAVKRNFEQVKGLLSKK